MKTKVRNFRRLILALSVALVLSATAQSQAQIVTGVRFNQVGIHTIAVPSYYYSLRQLRTEAVLRSLANTSEYWLVGMRTRNGAFTRSYRVGNSGEALRQARRDYPKASLIGVKKVYR